MRLLISALSVFLVMVVIAACAQTDSDDDVADDDVAATEDPTPAPETEPAVTEEPEETPIPDAEPSPTLEPAETPAPEADDAEGAEHIIDMQDNFFDPDTLEIAVGDTVTFINEGGLDHTATLDPDEARDADNILMPDGADTWHSGTMEPGDEFSITLDVPGEYQYVCRPHEAVDMIGVIIVGDGEDDGDDPDDDADDVTETDDDEDDDEADDYL